MTTDTIVSVQASCADDHDPNALPPDEALKRVLAGTSPVNGIEKLALRSALGRILAKDLQSTLDIPVHDNAAMDGYAVLGSDLPSAGTKELTVLGIAWAGKPFEGAVGPGACARIMTGALMPKGSDTVIMQEHIERQHDSIRLAPGHKPRQNVRTAGEEIAAGETVIRAGKRLVPADLGLVASLGIGEVLVRRRVRVAFFSTGDELRAIGESLSEGAIYDSNRYTLYGMLMRLGAEIIDMGVVPDVRGALRRALQDAASCADVIITSGGASVGEADFVTETLGSIGTVDFWKVAIKPGRPLAFGKVSDAVFFGLPGNPVSVMATFYQLVQPALRHMMGETDIKPLTVKAQCLNALKKKRGRVEYQRGVLASGDDGRLEVRTTGAQGSAMLTSMSAANCFIVLPHEFGRIDAGTIVDVQPFYGLV